ncbi:hypothetical protein ACOMHN_066678 [Nucella lapillus]
MNDYIIFADATWPVFVADSTSTNVGRIPEGCILKQVTEAISEDKKDDLIPESGVVFTRLIFFAVGLPLCFLVSFCTNILNMVVFYKQGLKERINMCLFTLSLLDLLYVAVA